MKNSAVDIELIRSKLGDAYFSGLCWQDIKASHPEVDEKFFNEVIADVENMLQESHAQLHPSEYYIGIGIEADVHENGLLLTNVYKACPAEAIGVGIGDIIAKVNFQTISNMDLLTSLKILRNSKYEEGVILEVIRAGELITLGYGINAQPKAIDAKRKYPLNLTALTIGKRLRMMQSGASVGVVNSKMLAKKQVPEMAI